MSDEITVDIRVNVRNGSLVDQFRPGPLTFDQSSQLASGRVQNIGTTAEAIVLGDVTTAGWSWFMNLDATNYVDIGTGSGTSFVALARLLPGEPAALPLHPSNAPFAKSNAATVNLQVGICSR